MNDRRNILLGSLASLAAAAIILVTTILPAEYGLDPLGTGAALGIVGFSEESTGALRQENGPPETDRINFTLAPFESLEYKYALQDGASVLFEWHATGEVLFDMHGEPEGAAEGYAVSYAAGRSETNMGSFTAPFTGIHGWFWQNRSQETVSIELTTTGYFEYAVEMRDGFETRYNP